MNPPLHSYPQFRKLHPETLCHCACQQQKHQANTNRQLFAESQCTIGGVYLGGRGCKYSGYHAGFSLFWR